MRVGMGHEWNDIAHKKEYRALARAVYAIEAFRRIYSQWCEPRARVEVDGMARLNESEQNAKKKKTRAPRDFKKNNSPPVGWICVCQGVTHDDRYIREQMRAGKKYNHNQPKEQARTQMCVCV